LQHEIRWRQCDDLVVGVIVFEIVVIILNEEHWNRTEICLVDGDDLRAADALEDGLVVAAENHARAVEPSAGECDRLWCVVSARKGRELIPVDVVAIGHHRIGLEAERAAKEPVAHGGGQECQRLMPAGAGEK
jgi:hypothetical protein